MLELEPIPRHVIAGREIRARLAGVRHPASRLPPPASFGLGDAVTAVAQPIARAIDRTAAAVGVRTNVAGCGGCKGRQAKLNALVPDLTDPFNRR